MIVHAGNVFWFDSSKKPDTNRLVLVDGGVAKWDGMLWINETGIDDGRVIRSHVRYWAELPKPPAFLMNSNAVLITQGSIMEKHSELPWRVGGAYAEPHVSTRIDRHCPRCNFHCYHWAKRDPLTNAVKVNCAACGHNWQGRFLKEEWNVE